MTDSFAAHTLSRSVLGRVARALIAALLGLSVVACGGTPTATPPPATVTISGSTAMIPLLTLLAEQFELAHPSTTVILRQENSFVGAMQVMDGTADLGAISVSPSDQVWAAPIAVDGLAIVVHPDNPVEDLTVDQVHDIFVGLVWRWSEIGAEDTPDRRTPDEIAVVSREEGSGERMTFESLVMGGSRNGSECLPGSTESPDTSRDNASDAVLAAKQVLRMDSRCEGDPVTTMAVLAFGGEDVIAFVSTRPGAIGYVSAGLVSLLVKVVAVEGHLPTPARVADGTYHLSQPFYLIAPQEPDGAAKRFVDFCLGAQGQSIIARQYAPVRSQ